MWYFGQIYNLQNNQTPPEADILGHVPPLKLTSTVKTPPKFWEQKEDPPKSQQKSGWPPIEMNDLDLF